MTQAEFYQVSDAVVAANGRGKLSDRPEVKACVEVRPDDCVLQILAGPGSGKTEVLVWRVLFELFVLNTRSERLVVTTFTKKAASEIQVRIADRVETFIELARQSNLQVADPLIHNLRIGTIHSLCEQFLTEFSPQYREQGLSLMDEHEHRARLGFLAGLVLGSNRSSQALTRLENETLLVRLFRPHWKRGDWPANRFDRAEFAMELFGHMTETYLPRCGNGTLHGMASPNNSIDSNLIELHQRWRDHLESKNVVDFAGIQAMFLQSQSLLNGKLTHVFVDEFQDTNPIQHLLHLGWLIDAGTKLTVVGDDDQAIYRFRGSDSSCFRNLQTDCSSLGRGFRLEKLEVNHRSSKNIIEFSQGFRTGSSIPQASLAKTVISPQSASYGLPVRVLRGTMGQLARVVSDEIRAMWLGVELGDRPSAAVLSFSTTEKVGRPAHAIRAACEPDIQVYNPRAKTAATKGSALADLLGVLSYLIDPVSLAPVGKNGRSVMVWALHDQHSVHARSAPPSKDGKPIYENDDHIEFQKWFRKRTSSALITDTEPSKQDVLDYIDQIRDRLYAEGRGNTRLTLAGLIARVLAFPYFQPSGFTIQLLRQALFTQLLEDFILPTRQTMNPLDSPLEVDKLSNKWLWAPQYWRFLGVFASVLKNLPIDDTESEAFEEGALPLITFHQSKGLEFDHVYVIGGGKPADVRPVLKNMLFSGHQVPLFLDGDLTSTNEAGVLLEAQADVDRELYVAISRAKKQLTLLSATDDTDETRFAKEHSAIESIVNSMGTLQPGAAGNPEVWELSYE